MSNQWLTGDVVVNGVRIHYYRTGGGRPPVVLAHGITDNGLCWIRLAQVLEEEYDLIMLDARGHGLSDAPKEGYSPHEHAQDLAGLIQALELEQPALIGHSMGAMNVAVMAATYPDLARCVILEDPPWWLQLPPIEEVRANTEQWRQDVIRRKTLSREEIIAEGKAQNPTWAEVEWEPWSTAKQQVSPRVFGWIMARTRFTPWQEIVAQIPHPLLLLTGDPDLGALVTQETAQEVVQRAPNARVVHIAGAGHSIRREQFEKYLQAVRAFLHEHLG